MSTLALACALASPIALPPRDAAAQSKTLTLDDITVEPSRLTGYYRIQAFVSPMTLEGDAIALGSSDLRLKVGGSALRAPYGVGRFGLSEAELGVVVVVETAFAYSEVLPVIQEVLVEDLISKLPDRARVAIVGYGESVQGGKLAPAKAARARVAALSPDYGPSDPALIEAVEHGLALFRRFKTSPPGRPMRKVIVLLSDGRDRLGERDRVTQVGQRADREGVRILSVAYSPTNSRRPLLNLGELSKQSRGTFRWLRAGEKQSWHAQIQRVREQLENQLVLTYFVEEGEELERLIGKRATASLFVGNGELSSTDLKIPRPSCAKDPCAAGQWCHAGECVTPREDGGRGVLGWILLILGVIVGALVALGGVGYVLSRRQPRPYPGAPGMPPGVPGVPGAPGVPGVGGVPGVPPGYPGHPSSSPPGVYAPGSQPPQPQAAPPGGPSLYIASGPRAGQRVALFHGFSLGKAPTSSLVIDDGYASTNHAQIAVDGRGFCTLYDRGSTNGTFVNGVRVTEMPLEHGAAIRIGATELRFLSE